MWKFNYTTYIDVDYAGSLRDIISTSGYFTFLYMDLVAWRTKKQSVISWSSVET